MAKRAIFSSAGIRVSKDGYDADTAQPENMAMYSGMNPCIPLASNSASFTGNGTRTFSFTNPSPGIVPVVILKSAGGIMPSRRTYYATLTAPYNSVVIRNVDGKARTVDFKVLF